MDEAGRSARSAADQLGYAKPSLTADIYTGGRKRAAGAAEVPTSPDWLALDRCFVDRSGLDSCAGLTSAGRPAVPAKPRRLPGDPDVAAYAIADRAVALVPPAVQGVNGNAQHFRDIRKRHQLVTGLECHDHLPFRGSQFRQGFGPIDSAWRPGCRRRDARASGTAGPPELSPTGDRQIPKSRSDSGRSKSKNKNLKLAWPGWKVATAVLAGGHRVVCVRLQLTRITATRRA